MGLLPASKRPKIAPPPTTLPSKNLPAGTSWRTATCQLNVDDFSRYSSTTPANFLFYYNRQSYTVN